jgi:hypothetical protein
MIVDRIDSLVPACAFCGEEIHEPEDLQAVVRTHLPWMFAERQLELRAHPRCLVGALNHRWRVVLGDAPEGRTV